MSTFIRRIPFLALALCGLFAAGQASAEIKIGVVNFEKLLGEIMCGINDFPSHLQLDDQGRFAIGYYHQMQDFFAKKNDSQPRNGD